MKKWIACLAVFGLLFAGCKKDSPDEPKGPSATEVLETKKPEAQEDQSDKRAERSLFKTKARSVIGDVLLLKGGNGEDWKQVRIGQWVIENDRVQTKIESEARLGALDGSFLLVSENSDVHLEAIEDSTGTRLYLVSVDNGKVYFDIQKQKNASFQFKTGSTGAAIRGTAGFVGNVQGKTVVSLKEGKVDVSGKTGKVSRVAEKQTILMDAKGNAKTLNLKSSGTKQLAKAIDSLTTAEVSVTTLQASLKSFDEIYAMRQNEFKKTLNFQSRKLPDTLLVPKVTLQAFVNPGVKVSVWGETDSIGSEGFYKKELSWDSTAYGIKRFLITCSDGIVDVLCDSLVTEYVPPAGTGDSALTDSLAKTSADAAKSSKILNLSVNLGAATEKVHMAPPQNTRNTRLNIKLDGISREDLSELSSITVKRGGKIVRTYNENQLTALTYGVPVTLGPYNTVGRGIIAKTANFEVVVKSKSGKEYTGRKSYQVFCNRGNHDPETNEAFDKNENVEYGDAQSYFENE